MAKKYNPDNSLIIDGFGTPFRTDRCPLVTGKKQGGGVCLYINQDWCRSVTVRESVCTKDLELLSVSLRPKYMPREFPQLFVTVVYIHPRANEANVVETIGNVLRLQAITPDAPNLILGDFNKCSMKQCLLNFYQYVSCPTRQNTTLDLCYGSIKDAYKAFSQPPVSGP